MLNWVIPKPHSLINGNKFHTLSVSGIILNCNSTVYFLRKTHLPLSENIKFIRFLAKVSSFLKKKLSFARSLFIRKTIHYPLCGSYSSSVLSIYICVYSVIFRYLSLTSLCVPLPSVSIENARRKRRRVVSCIASLWWYCLNIYISSHGTWLLALYQNLECLILFYVLLIFVYCGSQDYRTTNALFIMKVCLSIPLLIFSINLFSFFIRKNSFLIVFIHKAFSMVSRDGSWLRGAD